MKKELKSWRRMLFRGVIGVLSAFVAYGIVVLIVGDVMFAKAVVTDSLPTSMETVAMLITMLIVSVVVAMLTGGEKDGK